EEADETLALMLTEYLTLQAISDHNIANQTKESTVEGYKKAKANIDEIFVLIANCEKMVPIFEKKIAASPDDMDLKIKALKLMNGKDCTESDFYLDLADTVHMADPTHESAYAVGMGYLKKDEFSKSLNYFEQAVELCGDCPDLEKYLLRAGQVASVLKQTSKARSYANKVLKINPNSGDAYLLIGDAVATGAKQCADGGIGERAVYWVAVDYYYKAKSVDSSVADKAQKKINSYSGQFPTKEDLFTYGIAVGSTFDTCLGVSTKVRAR
ncbi:MAG: tetratricopeptide repeat protein, partial [Flavobacteriales bacterium]